MAAFLKKRKEAIGKSPGSMVFVGDRKTDQIRLRVIGYNKEKMWDKMLDHISEERGITGSESVTWINVDGLHDVEMIREVGDIFGLHPLLLDDIVNTEQRPKFQEYENCLFIVIKMMKFNDEDNKVSFEQFSMVIGEHFLLTFQEQAGDVFDPVRERIRNQRKRIRSSGADYLAYSLIDTVVDNYIYIIERLGEEIEEIEDIIIREPGIDIVETINRYKREMHYLRKILRPVRELVLRMTRSESELFKESTLPFLKDLLNLSTSAMESVEVYREMLSDYLNLYNTAVSNRMNDIMKVLTVFAAIFIPLTFIAGIYGTNFEYLPELHYRYSYFIFLGVMFFIGLSMLAYFKWKKWF